MKKKTPPSTKHPVGHDSDRRAVPGQILPQPPASARKKLRPVETDELDSSGTRPLMSAPKLRPVRERLAPSERRRYLREARQRQERLRREQRRQKLHQPVLTGRRSRGKQNEVAERSGPVVTTNWLENQERAEKEQEVREIPSWLVPLLALLILLLLLFILLPQVLNRIAPQAEATASETDSGDIQTIYGEQYLLASEPVVSIYAQADIRAPRIAQVLYNRPIERADRTLDITGFISVKVPDGRVGFVRDQDVTANMNAIEPARYEQRLVVTDVSKNVMSHASRGNVLVKVYMGTELYVTYENPPLYRVMLPGGEEGWLTSTGVIALGKVEPIPITNAAIFTETARVFSSAVLQETGISIQGMSMEGAARIAAHVNGLELPITMEQQLAELEQVPNVLNENGSVNYQRFEPGDMLYFSRDPEAQYELDPERSGGVPLAPPDKLGIWTDYGVILTDVPRRFVIAETEVSKVLEQYQLIAVRRPFTN